MLAHYVLEDPGLNIRSQEPQRMAEPAVRVLLISDDVRAARRFDGVLAEAYPGGECVTHAPEPQDGLRLIGSGRFDVAFVDMRYGSETSADVVHAAGGRLCATPMILMSADTVGSFTPDLESEAREAGAADFLDPRELSPALVRRVIRYARFNHQTARQLIVEGHRHRMKAETASAASEEKTRFLAQMSHELRTPLNAILGFTDLIKKELFGPIEGPGADRYRDYLDDIHTSGGHLLTLINDLLDLSKIEAGYMDMQPGRVQLADIVNDIARMTEPQATARKLSLSLGSPELADVTLFADPRLITQALLNLVANAIKFTPEGGTVALKARLEGNNRVIAIVDSGCGIAEEDMRRVLEPFRQAGATSQPGTGLGLPLAKAIMELHRGGLEIVSAPGEGTTVSVWLPDGLTAA